MENLKFNKRISKQHIALAERLSHHKKTPKGSRKGGKWKRREGESAETRQWSAT